MRTKRNWFFLLGLGLAIIGLAACASQGDTSSSTAESQIMKTVTFSRDVTPTLEVPTEPTLTITHTPQPTLTPTSEPSLTQTSSVSATLASTETLTPVPSMTPTKVAGSNQPSRGTGSSIVVFLILRNGSSAGCKDQAVPMSTGLAKSKDSLADVEKALKYLVSMKQKYYGNLYNPVAYSNLRVQEVEYDEDSQTLSVHFSGKYRPTGNRCDNTAVKAQIWSTAKQFGIRSTNFYINGIPFGDLLSND